MTPATRPPLSYDSMCDALLARGPAPELTDANNLFGWLAGSWDVEVHDFESDGARRVSNGEWHFAWVLEGRAIQDVFITPKREERSLGKMPTNRYGTTLRVFDPQAGNYQLVWINPVRGDISLLATRRNGDDLVQEGVDASGKHHRGVFSAIGPDGFTFTREEKADGTADWKTMAILTATRRA